MKNNVREDGEGAGSGDGGSAGVAADLGTLPNGPLRKIRVKIGKALKKKKT